MPEDTTQKTSPSCRFSCDVTGLSASWQPAISSHEDALHWLEDILAGQRITTVFQPIFNLRTADIAAYEALSRVAGPSRFSGPGAMFQAAQWLGLTARLEALCRTKALARARELGIEHRLTLNVCPSVLLGSGPKNGLPDPMEELYELRESLILELTERFYVKNQAAFQRVLSDYRKRGFRIAIDDLGSGFTGLKMLAELEPDMVKIDRSLISGIQRSAKKHLLLQAVVSFCHKIHAQVVAEGVETPQELHEVCRSGVDLAQGFYLARPEREPVGCNPQARAQIEALRRRPVQGRKDPNAIGSLARFEQPIDPGAPTEALIERFQQDHAPAAVPVVLGSRPVGIVHKTKLFYRLGQRFGYSLFSRKQVHSVMEPVLVFEESTVLEAVSRDAMDRDESAIYDTVIVIRNGAYVGLVEMHRLYERITEQKILLAAQANPLTGLPGNNLIKQEITRRMENNEIFAVVYVDLDHFKPFNDHHGFARGDSVIRFLGDLLKRSLLEWDLKGFAGHVGGDDFVAVCRSQGVDGFCQKLLARFDEEVKTFHEAEALRLGYYEASDRLGKRRRFPLLSLSLAVVSTRSRVIVSYGQLVSIASEVKRKAKEMPGSSYFMDRRCTL